MEEIKCEGTLTTYGFIYCGNFAKVNLDNLVVQTPGKIITFDTDSLPPNDK